MTESPAPWRVAIVGGGPAGCAAAHELAQQGISGVLLEQGVPDRDKPCGDMLVPSATAILRELGIRVEQYAQGSAGGAFDAVELRGSRGILWKVTYPQDAVWVVRRRLLDQSLRDSLPKSIHTLYSTAVSEIRRTHTDLFELDVRTADRRVFTVECESVVIASGAQNSLARAWGISGKGRIAPSISAYLDATVLKTPAFEFIRGCAPGYRWMFPVHGAIANVGICSLVRGAGAALRAAGNALIRDQGIAPDRVVWRGGAAPLWSGEASMWHHEAGIVSCGDAASLVDPINGEGITAALMSGRAAATAILGFLNARRDPASLRHYSRWVQSTFAAKYARSPVRTTWQQLCGLNIARGTSGGELDRGRRSCVRS